MFSSRKPLAVILAVMMVITMLAPAAAAAPEWVAGVNITGWGTAATPKPFPVYIDPSNPNLDGFRVRYDVTVSGLQVDDLDIRIRALDANGGTPVWTWDYVVTSDSIVEGVNHLTSDEIFPAWNYGWYALEVCVRDADFGSEWFCDVEQQAVLIDHEDPGVRLIKPADGAWISGTDYLLVGKAWDPWWAENDPMLRYGGIASTTFQYCVITNWQPQNGWCGPTDQSWRTLGAGVPTPGVPDQYDLIWDSTKVPDDWGVVRFCATDFVGRKVCDVHNVYVNNRFTVNLRPGWNLISTPLLLYNKDMDAVMAGLGNKVLSVYGYRNGAWTKWQANDSLGFDDGYGYWVKMSAPANLTFVGNWKSVGNQSPPEYPVAIGWNLIGYTHWGQPTFFMDQTVVEYLGSPMAPKVESLWRYDAMSETYVSMGLGDSMVKGAGYWLALSDGGTINP